jgi:superfamily II DNA or RNA helicase
MNMSYDDIVDVDNGYESGEIVIPESQYNYSTEYNSANPTIYITKTGAFIKFELLDSNLKLIRKIENYFTVSTKLITGHIKKVKSCTVDKTKARIIVPRFGIFEILSDKFKLSNVNVKSQIKNGEELKTPYKWIGKQTPNQKIISDHIFENIYTEERVKCGSAGLILNMEAGQGKSYLAAYVMYALQKKTAIILHTTSLVEQWVKVIRNSLGPDVSIGFYYSGNHVLGDIMIMIIDSATHSEFKFKTKRGESKVIPAIEFYNRFGFIVYDECHTYANKFSLKALKIAQAPYMLGLSATPDENLMGFDTLVWWELGPILHASSLPNYETLSEDFKATVHRVMYYGPPKYTKLLTNEKIDVVNTAATVNMICEDNIRSSIILDCIRKGLDLGLFMFVFADRREYLEGLRKNLMDSYAIEGEIVDDEKDFVRVVGGDKATALENAEVTSRVIFTTYQYMGTGKSIVKMNGLVLANPRKSKMKQYVGRIFRLGSDATVERHIYDICDMKLKCSNQWNTRKKYYDSKGYKVVTEKIKYNEWEGINIIDYIDELEINEDYTELKVKTIPNKKVNSIVESILSRLRA